MPRKEPPEGYLSPMESMKFLQEHKIIGNETAMYRLVKSGKIHRYGPTTRAQGYYKISELEAVANSENAFYDTPAVAEVQGDSIAVEKLTARVAMLESVIDALTSRLDALESERYNVATAPVATPVIVSQDVGNSNLPPDCVVLSLFAKMHNIPETTALRAAKNGKFPVVSGKWKIGRGIATIALDTDGQDAFIEMFRNHPQFRE